MEGVCDTSVNLWERSRLWLWRWQTAQRAKCEVDDRFFVDKVYPVLEAAECRMCHNDNGVASATRVHFPPSDAKPDAIRAFGLGLSVVVDRAIPTRRSCSGSRRCGLRTGAASASRRAAPEEATLQSWIAYLAKLAPARSQFRIRKA